MDENTSFDEYCLKHRAELMALVRHVNKDVLRDEHENLVFTSKDRIYQYRDSLALSMDETEKLGVQ